MLLFPEHRDAVLSGLFLVSILSLEANKLGFVGRSLLQFNVVFFIIVIIAVFVHMHSLEICNIDRAASEVSEEFGALASDLFKDLYPHFL